MPSPQEIRWSRLKSGMIVLGSIAILTTLVFVMASVSGVGMLSHRLTVTSYFDDTTGLKPGATVTLEGITIGTVKTVTVVASPEHKSAPVQVVMKLDNAYQSDLHTDSTVSLATAGVLGDTGIDISSQFAAGPQLRDGDELKTLNVPSLFSVEKSSQATVNTLKSTVGKLDDVVDNIETGKGSVGKLMNDPDLGNRVNATVDDIKKLTAKLNSDKNTVGKFLNSPANPSSPMQDALNNVASITKDLQDGKGTAGKALHDQSFQNNLKSSETHASSLLADVNAGKGSVGMLVKDPTVTKNLTDTFTQGSALLSNLNQGKGSAGQFLKGDETGKDLSQLETTSGSLIADIRKNPKKFFTIQFRIF